MCATIVDTVDQTEDWVSPWELGEAGRGGGCCPQSVNHQSKQCPEDMSTGQPDGNDLSSQVFVSSYSKLTSAEVPEREAGPAAMGHPTFLLGNSSYFSIF